MDPTSAGASLSIDLGAIVANWRALAARAEGAACAAVVKADAYGLGAQQVAGALASAGCRYFFVAHAEEGVALRRVLGSDPTIAVLHGPMPGAECLLAAHELVPVLCAPWQAHGWAAFAESLGRRLPAILQIDSGMTRLGLSAAELDALGDGGFRTLDLKLVMSHLACADEPDHPANAAQLAAFRSALARFPSVPASLSASSGIFLGPDYHFDLVRPGAALYGIAPRANFPNPMLPVVRLVGRVVQVRDVAAGTPVGYGWTVRTDRASRLATVALGYADGMPRRLSGKATAWRGGLSLPVIGRISMDSIVVDVTDLGADPPAPGDGLEFIGAHQSVDDIARAADTIGYEILTALGQRYHRTYSDT